MRPLWSEWPLTSGSTTIALASIDQGHHGIEATSLAKRSAILSVDVGRVDIVELFSVIGSLGIKSLFIMVFLEVRALLVFIPSLMVRPSELRPD